MRMRLVLNTIEMDGVIVIGEGEKDEAPMLYNGERLGHRLPAPGGHRRRPDRRHDAHRRGGSGALSVVALAPRGTMYAPGKLVYMNKIAVGPDAVGHIDIDAPVAMNLARSPRPSIAMSTT